MNDFYEARNSIYCYKDSNVLINKLNIMNHKDLIYYEAKITAAKLLGLRDKGITGEFDLKHIVSIHKYLFEDIYPFAGLFRNENIAKDDFRFAEWEYIEIELIKLLEQLREEEYLLGLDKQKLSNRLAYYMAELNVLHPFRDGNGRTIREFIRQLALKNGYSLNLKKIKPKEMLNASIKSVINTEELEEKILNCLEKVQNT